LAWRLGRVYFLAFLNPSQGQPDPALIARLASPATVDEATTELDARFTERLEFRIAASRNVNKMWDLDGDTR